MKNLSLKKTIIYVGAVILDFFLNVYRKFKPIPPRIYFCYNQSIHHIYHSIFIAIELSNIQKEYEVVIFSTSKEASDIIKEELSSIPNNIKFVSLRHFGYNKINFNINLFVLLCRLHMHKPKAVIVTDYFDNVFRQLRLKTFWVFVGHGPENRGYYSSNLHIKDYDLVIFPGRRDVEELEKKIGVLNNYVIIGYSKLDYFIYHKTKPLNLFKDSKPIIMYNPHFEKSSSSFFDKGMELLQSLSNTGKYNIILMPHPDLSRKYPELINLAKEIPNVAVINRPKINLDYMAIADIYITDVSSAVFEWLYFDKPVLFFNTKSEKNIYSAWKCGRIVRDTPSMLESIEYSLEHPEEFHNQRKEMFDKVFFNPPLLKRGVRGVSKMIAQFVYDRLKNI